MAEVRFLGEIRKAAGTARFGVDAGTVEELLEQLRRVMGQAFQDLVFQEGDLHQDIEILVNGRNIASLEGLKTPLSPFDQVTLSVNEVR